MMSTMKKMLRKCVHLTQPGKPGSTNSGMSYSPGYRSRNSGTPGRVVTPRAARTMIPAATMSPPSPRPTSLDHCPSDFEPIMTGSFFAAGFAEAAPAEPDEADFAAGAGFADGPSAVFAAGLAIGLRWAGWSADFAAGLAIGLRWVGWSAVFAAGLPMGLRWVGWSAVFAAGLPMGLRWAGFLSAASDFFSAPAAAAAPVPAAAAPAAAPAPTPPIPARRRCGFFWPESPPVGFASSACLSASVDAA